jgi:hypothetical protein
LIEPQPAIELLGVRINEPVTTLTDLFISFVCFYAFFHIYRLNKSRKSKTHQYLQFYFLSMGTATALGGIVGHGFLYLFNDEWELPGRFVAFITNLVGESQLNPTANPWKLPGWLTSMFSIALIERAVIEYSRKILPNRIGNFFAWLNIIELLFFMTLTFSTLNFFFVEIHTFYGFMIVVLGFSLFTFRRLKNKGSKLFIIAVGFSAISALFFMNEWSFHTWFNYLDISHIFLTVSAYFFYKGSIKLIKEEQRLI